MKRKKYTRRETLKLGGLAGLGFLTMPVSKTFKPEAKMISRTIPSSGEKLPIVGLGTWQTFDVNNSGEERQKLKQVLIELNKYGGRLIDSSPMYGSSESVVGDLTSGLEFQNDFLYGTKVWTSGKESGIRQMQKSMKLMKRNKMDLIQIHNLMDWETHLRTLRTWKDSEQIRYWGITHYVDSAHSRLENIIKAERPDFVQFNYSILSRNAENSLLDTAEKYKTAAIINQPFDSGRLFSLVRNKPLPDWCMEYDINSWGQYFLKFILSDRRIACVIPGTSKPHHMIDNAMAGYGKLPDEKIRKAMIDEIE